MSEATNQATSQATPVIVAYSLKPTGDKELAARLRNVFAASLSAPSNYKDPDKIAQYKADLLAAYDEEAARQPYTAAFDRVRLVAPTRREIGDWSSDEMAAAKKPPVAVAAAAWLSKRWPVVLYGFEVNRFIDVLYTACAVRGRTLPPAFWLDRANRPCRDVSSCLVPSAYGKYLTPEMALLAFGERIGGVETAGFVPCQDPSVDTRLAYELLVRLDIVPPQD